MNSFDPYHKWLGIPREEQPASHYRLLGIVPLESDPEVIEAAADRQMKYVSQCAIGEHLKLSQQLLNELSAARVCLLVPAKKQAYDAQLKAKLDEARRLEMSLTPVMLDDPHVEPPAPSSQPTKPAPVSRQLRLKTSRPKFAKSRKKSSVSPKTLGIAGLIVAFAFIGFMSIWSAWSRRTQSSANTTPAKPDLPLIAQTQLVEPTPAISAQPEAPPMPRGNTDPPVADVPRPVTVEPPHNKSDDKHADQQMIDALGNSLVATKGDAKGAVIGGSEEFSPTESFTIEFWVSTKADRGTLISKRHADGEPSIIVHLHDGVPNLSIAIGGGERGSGGGPPINDGKWHHIAIVKGMDLLTLFIDGRRTVQTTESTSMLSPSPWVYGCSNSRIPCAARFGGIRISKSARYDGPFEPQPRHVADGETLLQQ